MDLSPRGWLSASFVDAPSAGSTPLWVTLLVGLAGAIATLVAVLLTLLVTSQHEKARSEEETNRQEMRLKAEESRLLNAEGRAAVSAFLAVATRFEDVTRVRWLPDEDAIRKAEDAIREALVEVDLAVARVQVTCSVAVAGIASMMTMTASLFQLLEGDDKERRKGVSLDFLSRHNQLIRAVRDELGLNDPKPGEERSKSWLVTGPEK